MQQYSEKYLERKLGEMVRGVGGLSIKMPAYLTNGLPDRLVIFPGGRMVFVELKSTGKKPSAQQKLMHANLVKRGCEVRVIDNYEMIYELIRKYEK